MTERCGWVPLDDLLYVDYHDSEWGVPIHEDGRLFELLLLEGAQAGLSWKTILHKRENYRNAFHNFDPVKISMYDESTIEELMLNAGIIRNRLKISAFILNSRQFLKLQDEYGSFHDYVWEFVNGKPIDNSRRNLSEIPSRSPESDSMSKDLKKRGFKFVGSTICYAFMQASGLVNDHVVDCFRYPEISYV